ncbi:class I SAM-dependent methyltransferase [Pseudovibrio exalbescens]|uniref:class I SAM-dependent methyltransferase n=1 Tax=Pseudovibrio exalbescens TaxID=197461 RepID=UPI002366C4C5|nr:class I SAM-dependent methyltransferase [Pseudovibrio exalbescens]MDD7910199.1 class I SAM-dependent methyltransferase [Pseudovibrio exalbescens]
MTTHKTLLDKIKFRIAHQGPITIAEYMNLCLADPEFGYYMTREPFGAKGDFTTAPEVSQLFGEIIGAWLVNQWQQDGAPDAFHLVELGPGRGTLMKDVLRVANLRPAFMQAAKVHMVETSPRLKQVQKNRLSRQSIQWHESFESIPEGPLYVIANELFDALPVHQYQLTPQGWRERCVGLTDAGDLTFGFSTTTLDTRLLAESIKNAGLGSILELSPASTALATSIAQRITAHGGSALYIDYGYTQTQVGDTLQALKEHAYVSCLETPGQADLTAHVNFEALATASKKAGAIPHGPITQADFLLSLGLLERAGQLGAGKSEAEQTDIRQAVERLAADNQMGTLFKLLAITANNIPPVPFSAKN